jgi:dipeptidyl-peptidase-4
VAHGRNYVAATTNLNAEQTQFTVHRADGRRINIPSFAEQPCITPEPTLLRVTERSLPAAVLLPRNGDQRNLPVIMSPYAGPHAQRVVQSRNAYATEQWIADHGYAVVLVDGAGTPGRGPINERRVHLDLADPVLADQVDALHALAQQYPVMDLSRVGIRGWSFGGYLAALAVLRRPDVFHAAVAGAPVTDWRLYDTAYTERYLGNPSIDDTPYQRTDLIALANQLTRPLLLIHGLADDNVVAAHTLQLSSALLAAGKDHDVLPLSGITHMTPQEIVAENLLLREISFFDEHLRGL